MSFTGRADHYDRWMGRYTATLAPALADAADITPGMRVLDVGSGPGGLTAVLAARIGEENVAAVDPAAQFVHACRERHPAADVREGAAEELPWEDGSFDAALACLVVAFMSDPDRGLAEMARVTRPGGTVAACMWDVTTGGMRMLSLFWETVRELHPAVTGERALAGTAEGDIAERLRRAGLDDVTDGTLTAHVDYTGFEDFWEPFTFGLGPAGQHLASLPPDEQEQIRELLRAKVGQDGPFRLEARAWYGRGRVAGA